MRVPSARRVIARVGMMAIAALLALLGLEAALRAFNLQSDFFFQPDAQVSVTFIPGKRGWFVYPDGRQWVEINSVGYRDLEWNQAKPPGTTRIVFLGDSYVASMEVDLADRASNRLEDRLRDACARSGPIEVMNFGVTGYGTAQELETLRHRAAPFRPDVVVLLFYTGNDLFNNSLELDLEPNRLHYRLGADGGLERLPYEPADNAGKRWLRKHSRAYLFVRDRVKRIAALRRTAATVGLMASEAGPGAGPGLAETTGNEADALSRSQHLVPEPPPIERAWRLTRALLAEVERVSASLGAELRLVLLPTREEIAYAAGLGPDTPEQVDYGALARRFDEHCQTSGVSCLDLTAPFVAAANRLDDLYFPRGGHWTPAGQSVAAEALFEWLAPELCASSEPEAERTEDLARP